MLPTSARAESAGRDIRGQLESGGFPRSYLLHVPAGYDARRPGPLVLALHGGGGQG
ncbi:MAG TPA: esterase, partial [Methylomirabilota bacterium]|nr:esterase [Methylomirabilota bacterium]